MGRSNLKDYTVIAKSPSAEGRGNLGGRGTPHPTKLYENSSPLMGED
ncbi:MAG: hypothetical protein HYY41_03620 [Chloroflexi bacterium]|nr:hypothetical protein [Chloroflexota bacterium]